MKKVYKQSLIALILAAIIIIVVSTILYVNNKLPDTLFVSSNQITNYEFSLPVSLDVENENNLRFTGKNNIYAGKTGRFEGEYKLFGIISLKKAQVKVVNKKQVYPLGLPIGLYLKTQGVMIINTGEFVNDKGESVSPAKNMVYQGEYITELNGVDVSNKAQLSYLIDQNKEEVVTIQVRNENSIRQVKMKPVKSNDGHYMLGIWVRDDSQGIGTLSFITEDNNFAALGHGISDIDTGKLLSSNDGTIFNANIWGIQKGEKGKPGGLCGTIEYNYENNIGKVTKNTNSGLFGKVKKDVLTGYNINKMEIGLQSEVKEGSGEIQFILDGKIKRYSIEILEKNENIKEKNMVIEITDKELLQKTNGIVQGMSGCPIIQNGKLIGVVTHVMINNPKKGYGIFVENMLE